MILTNSILWEDSPPKAYFRLLPTFLSVPGYPPFGPSTASFRLIHGKESSCRRKKATGRTPQIELIAKLLNHNAILSAVLPTKLCLHPASAKGTSSGHLLCIENNKQMPEAATRHLSSFKASLEKFTFDRRYSSKKEENTSIQMPTFVPTKRE